MNPIDDSGNSGAADPRDEPAGGDELAVNSKQGEEKIAVDPKKLDGDPAATMLAAIAGTAAGGAIGLAGGPVGVIAGMIAGATAGVLTGNQVPDFTTVPLKTNADTSTEEKKDLGADDA